MAHVPLALRRAVVARAGERCEYCGLAQAGQAAAFHLDHVLPTASGGETILENLALACVSCSLRKGAQRSAADPATGKPAPLFDPRRERWAGHFQWRGMRVAGLTPSGRATAELLRLNRPLILAIRAEEMIRQRHPPPV